MITLELGRYYKAITALFGCLDCLLRKIKGLKFQAANGKVA